MFVSSDRLSFLRVGILPAVCRVLGPEVRMGLAACALRINVLNE